MSVSVVGAGALGCMVCARLSHAGVAARLVVRAGSAKEALARSNGGVAHIKVLDAAGGLSVTAAVPVATEAPRGSLVILATKVTDAPAALEALDDRKVLLLCNGALSVLSSASGAGVTTHGCWEKGPFEVVHAGNGRVWTSDDQFHSLLSRAALAPVKVTPAQMSDRLWRKLAANAVLNPLTALYGLPNGEALATSERVNAARAVLAELAAVHNAALDAPSIITADRPLDAGDLYDSVLECAEENALNFSSMFQDLKNKRQTEIDALNGWIVRLGAQLGVETPQNALLATRVRAATKEACTT